MHDEPPPLFNGFLNGHSSGRDWSLLPGRSAIVGLLIRYLYLAVLCFSRLRRPVRRLVLRIQGDIISGGIRFICIVKFVKIILKIVEVLIQLLVEGLVL